MKSVIAYILIGIVGIAVLVIPIFLMPVLLRQITNFPEEHPCTALSCAEQIIANCQPSHIQLDSGPLGGSVRINVTGWDEGQIRCKLEMQKIPGEFAFNPPPYYLCSVPKDELRNWNGWRDSAEGVEIERHCQVRAV